METCDFIQIQSALSVIKTMFGGKKNKVFCNRWVRPKH